MYPKSWLSSRGGGREGKGMINNEVGKGKLICSGCIIAWAKNYKGGRLGEEG